MTASRIGGLDDFLGGCEGYFADGGCIIDQPFQERLPDGMIRCYMATDHVVGFGHQFVTALLPPRLEGANSPSAQPGLRIMHPASAEAFRPEIENGIRVDSADDATPRHRA